MVRTMHDHRSIERLRKTASGITTVAAAAGALLFWRLVSMADLADPLHVMLLLATALVLGSVTFGLIALGAYCRSWIREAREHG